MLIPYNTDAPLYHAPIVTGGLIVVNLAAFVAGVLSGAEAVVPWIMQYEAGLTPIQWVTSNFVHGDIMHLVGNMVFLWTFGLIVEGKIGPLLMLAVYFGIGIISCFIEQLLLLGQPGGSFGASGIIFGLMAIAMVWAPKNDVSCLLLIGFRPIHFAAPVIGLGLAYIGLQIFEAWLTGFSLSSAMLHLEGAALGLVVGVVMLKADWVDCENWDVFAMIGGRLGEAAPAKPPKARPSAPQRADASAAGSPLEEDVETEAQARDNAVALESLRQMIARGEGRTAYKLNQKLSATRGGWQLPERELIGLVDATVKQQAWDEAVALLRELAQRFPRHATRARMKLAHLLLRTQRPAQAQRVLAKIPREALSPEVQKQLARLDAEAARQREEGVVELESQDW